MVFSSISFLFFFLPLLFLCYFIVPRKARNYVLLIFSLLFYYFGEKEYVLLLLFSCLANYICGLLIGRKHQKRYLVIGLLINIGLLFYYKYTNFFLGTFSNLFHFSTTTLKIILPLGISFFTFQNISYLIDVYRKDALSQKNFFTYCTYIALFPQLVAGPIVRYKDVCEQLENRKESFSLFSDGVRRFVIGLGKKVLIADTFYHVYIVVMASEMTFLSYWLVALSFTFQIYYDFSGYSDMAIGLGKMFGFDFKENFNYPLIASSITDFWRRWHMSLSSFFRDYVYIPLGGNRCSVIKNIRNIFIVWLLTGLWHGADWNFIFWGLYFFFFLILEKFFLKKFLKGGILSHLYTFLIVIFSFVIFTITDLPTLGNFLKGMVGVGTTLSNSETIYFIKNNMIIFIVAFVGMSPYLKNKLENLKKGKFCKEIDCGEVIYILLVFLLVIATIISSTFNPFIYFRF